MPASCMVAMYESVVLANRPSKPGKPGWLKDP
jgi:hypothetical protein